MQWINDSHPTTVPTLTCFHAHVVIAAQIPHSKPHQNPQRAFPIVDEQLQRAGVRMAALFSALLG
jgi:hypothetical protein